MRMRYNKFLARKCLRPPKGEDLFRRRRIEDCVQACTEILEANPYDQVSYVLSASLSHPCQQLPATPPSVSPPQAAWFLKLRSLTEQTYVDEVDMDEEGIAETFLDDTAIADVASELLLSTSHHLLSLPPSYIPLPLTPTSPPPSPLSLFHQGLEHL